MVWKHPSIKRFHHAILKAVMETPSIDVMMASSLYKAGKAKKPAAKKRTVSQKAKAVAAAKATAAREVKAAREKEQRDRAAQVAQDLRAKLPMQRPLKFASERACVDGIIPWHPHGIPVHPHASHGIPLRGGPRGLAP